MIRFVLRFIGLLLLALGFIFLVHDGTKSIADQTIYLTSVGSAWSSGRKTETSPFEASPAMAMAAPVAKTRSTIAVRPSHSPRPLFAGGIARTLVARYSSLIIFCSSTLLEMPSFS